jgi:hypothetical protein
MPGDAKSRTNRPGPDLEVLQGGHYDPPTSAQQHDEKTQCVAERQHRVSRASRFLTIQTKNYMKTTPTILRPFLLAVCAAMILAAHPRLSAQMLVLDDFSAGDIRVTNSTPFHSPGQDIPGVFGGHRTLDMQKADESSASSIIVGSGVLTWNKTAPAAGGDYSWVTYGTVGSVHDLSLYNAFRLTVVSAPDIRHNSLWIVLGSTVVSYAYVDLPASGIVYIPFSLFANSDIPLDLTQVQDVQLGLNNWLSPGTYVFDNFEALVIPEHYVAPGSTNPVPPFLSWSTAATNIQDAVDAATVSGAVVWVADGTYAAGARPAGSVTNRLAVTKPLAVRSVNGPESTIIQGYLVPGTTNGAGGICCVYLTNGASLSGFTLTNGAGGVRCESTNATISNCVIARNVAFGDGGGAYRGTLNDCTLAGNSAIYSGGGANGSMLNNCTLVGNSVRDVWCVIEGGFGPGYCSGGGGASSSTVNSCTLIGNFAFVGGGIASGILNDCIVTGNSGGGAYRSTLTNCSVAGNSGGGACNCTLYNCTLSGNSAESSGGGGAAGSTLYNCKITGNVARYGGGAGADGWGIPSTLDNCTVVDNLALDAGGGAANSSLVNCIVAYNAAWADDNCTTDSTLNYCCTVPLPTNGVGNISVPPLFMDYASGNLRLQCNSPCINAGNNAYAARSTDLDGNPRIVSGTVDMGAYEFQSSGSRISYAWLQTFGLPVDGSADYADPDHDGMNNWQEWRCQTGPTDRLSALRLLSAVRTGTNVRVTWQSVPGLSYFLEASTNLAASPAFTLLAPNLVGQPGMTTSFTHTNAASSGLLFYRVGVSPP